MRKYIILASLLLSVLASVSFSVSNADADNLRKIYSQSPDKWPAPTIDDGVEWSELAILPESPLEKYKDSLKHIIELGKNFIL